MDAPAREVEPRNLGLRPTPRERGKRPRGPRPVQGSARSGEALRPLHRRRANRGAWRKVQSALRQRAHHRHFASFPFAGGPECRLVSRGRRIDDHQKALATGGLGGPVAVLRADVDGRLRGASPRAHELVELAGVLPREEDVVVVERKPARMAHERPRHSGKRARLARRLRRCARRRVAEEPGSER